MTDMGARRKAQMRAQDRKMQTVRYSTTAFVPSPAVPMTNAQRRAARRRGV